MKVGELLSQLSKLDPDLDVIYTNIGSGMHDGPCLVETLSVDEEEDHWSKDAPYPYKKVKVAYLNK